MLSGRVLTMGAVVLATALPVRAAEIDSIAAKVDSTVILRSDVIAEMRRAGMDASQFDTVRNEMIDRKLILKAAQDAKMTMQDWVVENRVREIVAKAFEGDRNRLVESLAREKITYNEWHDRLREDMIVSAMRWQVVDKNAVASPAAIRAEYKAHPDRYAVSKRTTVSVILLKPEEAAKRNEVQEALKSEPFADVARRYSSDAHASEGGVWKDVNPDEVFRPEICAEISAMPKGTLSRWIDLDGWSFLLRKDDEQEMHTKSFADAFDDIEANVKAEVAKRLYAEWLDRLKAEAYIKIYE